MHQKLSFTTFLLFLFYIIQLTNSQQCSSMTDGCTGENCQNGICLKCDNNKDVSSFCFCEAGQYYDFANQVCIDCNPSCKTCYGPNLNHCLSCDTNIEGLQYYKLTFTCQCEHGQYISDGNSCIKCYKFGTECLAKCPQETEEDPETMSCLKTTLESDLQEEQDQMIQEDGNLFLWVVITLILLMILLSAMIYIFIFRMITSVFQRKKQQLNEQKMQNDYQSVNGLETKNQINDQDSTHFDKLYTDRALMQNQDLSQNSTQNASPVRTQRKSILSKKSGGFNLTPVNGEEQTSTQVNKLGQILEEVDSTDQQQVNQEMEKSNNSSEIIHSKTVLRKRKNKTAIINQQDQSINKSQTLKKQRSKHQKMQQRQKSLNIQELKIESTIQDFGNVIEEEQQIQQENIIEDEKQPEIIDQQQDIIQFDDNGIVEPENPSPEKQSPEKKATKKRKSKAKSKTTVKISKLDDTEKLQENQEDKGENLNLTFNS